MDMLKLGFFAALAFLSAVAIFIGFVLILTSLQLGSVTLSYTAGKEGVTETISRATDAARFWRLVATMGVLPLVGGGAALWYAIRNFRIAGRTDT